MALSKGWERFALKLVSSRQLVTPDDLETMTGEGDFLLAFAEAVQQTSLLGDLNTYIQE